MLIHALMARAFGVLSTFRYRDVTVYVVKRVFPGYRGVGLGESIYVVSGHQRDEQLLRHEYQHVCQCRRYGLLGFLARYLGAYLWNLIRYRNHTQAYRNIPFELEARAVASQ